MICIITEWSLLWNITSAVITILVEHQLTLVVITLMIAINSLGLPMQWYHTNVVTYIVTHVFMVKPVMVCCTSVLTVCFKQEFIIKEGPSLLLLWTLALSN